MDFKDTLFFQGCCNGFNGITKVFNCASWFSRVINDFQWCWCYVVFSGVVMVFNGGKWFSMFLNDFQSVFIVMVGFLFCLA